MTDAELRDSIQQTLSGQLGGQALLRRFLAHDDWHAPAGRDDEGRMFLQVLRDKDHRRYLFICTGRPAYDDLIARVGEATLGGHYVTLPGVDLFAGLPADVDIVGVNAYSPPELHYTGGQVTMLNRWARAVEVEQTLAQPAPDLGLVRRFASYYVVLQMLPGGERAITLAPDRRGRKLAAVFTAPDTLDAFLNDRRDGGLKFEPAAAALSGEQLFGDLRDMPIDGIIFNCAGPAPPRTFVPAFAGAVLAAA